jgi:signal transduction histidine kinase
MSRRGRLVLYLVLVHVLFAAAAMSFVLGSSLWLLAVEAVFLASLAWGFALLRGLFADLDTVRTAAQLMEDGEFMTRLRAVGQPEMDALVRVYNRMIDHLREERVRLQEQHYFLEKVVSASPSGILTLDFDGSVALANPAALELLRFPHDAVRGRRLDEAGSAFAATLAGLGIGESKVVVLDGRRRVKCQRSEFLDRGFPRSFFLLQEVTRELRQSERAAYEKLIRMMSHEVNNSVGAVNSLLHSCLNYKDQLREEDRKDFEAALRVAVARTEQLSAFMRGFADVVRLPPPRLAPCDVCELLDGVAALMRPERERRRIAWKWDVREPPPPVAMDRAQMEQVFVNVVKNAIEAIGEDGTITVRVGRNGGRGFVVVEDTGGGLTPEARAHLFTPFFSTKQNGQGIGLTLVQEVLGQHGFEFSLEGPPRGPTQFVVRF